MNKHWVCYQQWKWKDTGIETAIKNSKKLTFRVVACCRSIVGVVRACVLRMVLRYWTKYDDSNAW